MQTRQSIPSILQAIKDLSVEDIAQTQRVLKELKDETFDVVRPQLPTAVNNIIQDLQAEYQQILQSVANDVREECKKQNKTEDEILKKIQGISSDEIISKLVTCLPNKSSLVGYDVSIQIDKLCELFDRYATGAIQEHFLVPLQGFCSGVVFKRREILGITAQEAKISKQEEQELSRIRDKHNCKTLIKKEEEISKQMKFVKRGLEIIETGEYAAQNRPRVDKTALASLAEQKKKLLNEKSDLEEKYKAIVTERTTIDAEMKRIQNKAKKKKDALLKSDIEKEEAAKQKFETELKEKEAEVTSLKRLQEATKAYRNEIKASVIEEIGEFLCFLQYQGRPYQGEPFEVRKGSAVILIPEIDQLAKIAYSLTTEKKGNLKEFLASFPKDTLLGLSKLHAANELQQTLLQPNKPVRKKLSEFQQKYYGKSTEKKSGLKQLMEKRRDNADVTFGKVIASILLGLTVVGALAIPFLWRVKSKEHTQKMDAILASTQAPRVQ